MKPRDPRRHRLAEEDDMKIDRYTDIDEKLRDLIAASPIPPAWHNAWLHSTRDRESTGNDHPNQEAKAKERLAVWRAVRDSGVLPDDAGFFLVAEQVMSLAELQIADLLGAIERRVDAVYAESGFEEWRTQARQDAEDFEQFQDRCPQYWHRLYFNMLQMHGEEAIAQLYRTDRKCFYERFHAGFNYFYPPQPATLGEAVEAPKWLKDFRKRVVKSKCIVLPSGAPPCDVEMRFRIEEDCVEADLWLARIQFVGGPHDGRCAIHRFVLDIEMLRDVFDEVDACVWEPFDEVSSPFGSNAYVKGTYQGHRLNCRVLRRPFADSFPVPVAVRG